MKKVFIDCGTHLGMGFSRLSTELNLDHTWEIFGFEANPIVFDEYVKNIESEKYPPLMNKNLHLENKAVWISDEGIEFSLRGITDEHYSRVYEDDKDKSNPFYNSSWEPMLANMAAEDHGLSKKEILDIPWDGGSCVKSLKNKIKDSEDRKGLYKWHEDVLVESIDLSQWIMDNFSKKDFIILKMDIEGAEYTVLPKMIKDGSIDYINKAFIEWHDWIMPEYKDKTNELMNALQDAKVTVGGWY